MRILSIALGRLTLVIGVVIALFIRDAWRGLGADPERFYLVALWLGVSAVIAAACWTSGAALVGERWMPAAVQKAGFAGSAAGAALSLAIALFGLMSAAPEARELQFFVIPAAFLGANAYVIGRRRTAVA